MYAEAQEGTEQGGDAGSTDSPEDSDAMDAEFEEVKDEK